MGKRKDLNPKIAYQKRLLRRYKLASKFGALAYYSSALEANKGKKYPMPLPVLQGVEKMVESEIG